MTILSLPLDVRKMSAVSIPNGNYYINVRSKVASSVDIPGASGADSTAIQLYSGNGSKAQQFTFTKQSDGSYVIVNVNSGKALTFVMALRVIMRWCSSIRRMVRTPSVGSSVIREPVITCNPH